MLTKEEFYNFLSCSTTKPVDQQNKAYLKLLWILSNYKNVPNITVDEKYNFFQLYVCDKVSFDLDVLRLFDQMNINTQIEYINTWNTYLKNGSIINDIPLLFENKQLVLPTEVGGGGGEGKEIDISTMDIVYFLKRTELHNLPRFESCKYKLPGFVSYHLNAPGRYYNRLIEFNDTIEEKDTDNTTCIGRYNQYTLEQAKIISPATKRDVIIFVANSYQTTLEEYYLAYLLCKRKLVIKNDIARKEWVTHALKSRD
jgi:hypothetical protein